MDGVSEALKQTPKGKLSYSAKWDKSSEAERRELLAGFGSPSPFSPDNAAYLVERLGHFSLEASPSPTKPSGSAAEIATAPSKMKLRLVVEGDSPPSSPIAISIARQVTFETTTCSHCHTITTKSPSPTKPAGSFLHSTLVATETKLVAVEISVQAEQEAELCERERELEERLQREAEERLALRVAYIKEMEERLVRGVEEELEQARARRGRQEDVKKAKLEALEMQWRQRTEREMERLAEMCRQHGEELEAKLREGQEQEKEITRRNQERKKQALLRLQQKCESLKQECQSLLEKMNSLLASCIHRHLLPEAASRAYQTGCQVLLCVQPLLEQHHALDEEQVAVLHSYVTSVHPLLAEVNSGVQEATQRGLQEDREKKRQQEQQQEQEQLDQQKQQQLSQQSPGEPSQKTPSSQPAQPRPVSSGTVTTAKKVDGLLSTPMGISPSVMELYSRLQEKLVQVTASCEVLTKDPKTKKYKFDLQKAISTPINAISGQSGEHLMDKIRRLDSVLSGKRVQVTGRQVSAGDHPQGRAYCFYLLSQKIVKQGDEQVSSQSDAAFPIAMVMASLCVSFPELRDLVLAQFHASCPVLVPFYASSKDLSDENRFRLLGYKVGGDGQVEGEDSYLKRMSGIVRLYAAFLQTPTKPRPHPHGLEHGWVWLARVLNMEPHPTLTATAIYHMLEITGYALMREYGKQFQKMLYYICKHYIPCMERITPGAQRGPLTRLKLFLEKCVASGSIPRPKGLLGDDFWRAHSHGITTA